MVWRGKVSMLMLGCRWKPILASRGCDHTATVPETDTANEPTPTHLVLRLLGRRRLGVLLLVALHLFEAEELLALQFVQLALQGSYRTATWGLVSRA